MTGALEARVGATVLEAMVAVVNENVCETELPARVFPEIVAEYWVPPASATDSPRASSMKFPSQNGLKPETGGVKVNCTVLVFIAAANSMRTSLAGLIPVAPSCG